MVDSAQPQEVAAFATELPDSYLQCRDFGHEWRPLSARWETDGYWERSLRCVRCYSERVQTLSRTGAVLAGHYVYPDGYLHAGLGRIVGDGRDALRLETVQRLAQGNMRGLARGRGKVA